MALADIIASMNTTLQRALVLVLPAGPLTDFILAHAFLVLTVVAGALVLAFLLIALFFDFAKDAWKVPFGMGADVLKYLGLFHPAFFLASAALGAGSFMLISHDSKFFRVLFSIISVAAVVAAWYWNGIVLGVLIALAPVNTMMMFIATIID